MRTGNSESRVVEHWNRPHPSDRNYWSLPAVIQYMNRRASGDPLVDWIDHVCRQYLGPALPLDRCLSLVCGNGHLERTLAARGVFRSCDAFDISDQRIADAAQRADLAGLPIRYACVDVNEIALEALVYDAAFAYAGVHHIRDLERLYAEVHRSLKPGGWFILNEYTGPSQFQIPERQLEVLNAALKLLPCRYRASISQKHVLAGDVTAAGMLNWPVREMPRRIYEKWRAGQLGRAIRRRVMTVLNTRRRRPVFKDAVERWTVKEMNLFDPSEAIRSAEIIPLLRQQFEIVELKPLGGSVFHLLLDDIAGNFDPCSEEDRRVLEMILNVEETLIACRDLQSDFSLIVARKA
jgi:SAM-dependent methyltransferase